PQCRLRHAARARRRLVRAAAGRICQAARNRLRVGRAARRRPDAGDHAELLRARANRRRFRRPSRGLSDLHDDEFRLDRHRHLSGRAWILRQRGVRATRERKERQRHRDRLFGAGLHRGFRVVEAVREAYQGRLTLVPTLLQAAQAKGLTTAAVGKFGAAFIQDYRRGGIILDEDAAIPLAFAKELQNAGYALPRNSVHAHPAGALTLAKDNGDPTAPIPIQRLKDGQTANPLDRSGALSRRGCRYLTDVFLDYILPVKQPDLTVFWSKEPDATNHAYGPGTYNSIDATRMNDEILGRVMDKLRQLGWEQSTDIIITQDHNHSTVYGDV